MSWVEFLSRLQKHLSETPRNLFIYQVGCWIIKSFRPFLTQRSQNSNIGNRHNNSDFVPNHGEKNRTSDFTAFHWDTHFFFFLEDFFPHFLLWLSSLLSLTFLSITQITLLLYLYKMLNHRKPSWPIVSFLQASLSNPKLLLFVLLTSHNFPARSFLLRCKYSRPSLSLQYLTLF